MKPTKRTNIIVLNVPQGLMNNLLSILQHAHDMDTLKIISCLRSIFVEFGVAPHVCLLLASCTKHLQPASNLEQGGDSAILSTPPVYSLRHLSMFS